MTGPKHTPGPWHAGGTFLPGTPDAHCSIWGATPPGLQSGDEVAQQVHPNDAPLIAAAPDLLAELQAAHRLLSLALGCMTPAGQAKFARQSEMLGLGTDGATRHHERAVAIAAATGEQA